MPSRNSLARPLGLFLATAAFCLLPAVALAQPAVPAAKKAVLRAAARTFSTVPKVGTAAAATQIPHSIERVIGDLKSTLVLFEYGDTKLCFLTSSLSVQSTALNLACRGLIAKELGIKPEQVVEANSHNHTVPLLVVNHPEAWGQPGPYPPKSESNEVAREFLEAVGAAARGLDQELVPVTVEWGVAREERVTYNRRGHRPDGSTYFIREEDRVLLGDDYIGTIDPDATVVVLRGPDAKPVAALAHFTGHPVTAYNPEVMISFGQWSQVACDKLSAYLGNVPVAFFQGCCGDINSKYMLTGTVEQAQQLGGYLGDSYIAAAKHLRRSLRTDLRWTRSKVDIPQADLPDAASLERDLTTIDDFIRRGQAGDQNTLACVGMNFPKALSPAYRAQLIRLVRPWYVWALDERRSGTADQLPKALPIEVVVARFGDVGYVGMPFEPFVRIGLRIKREAPLPCVLPSGYTEAEYGYIPDASATNDREYMSGYFRYIAGRLPYRAPAGEVVAEVTVPILKEFSR